MGWPHSTTVTIAAKWGTRGVFNQPALHVHTSRMWDRRGEVAVP
jgi:hypothetical protein